MYPLTFKQAADLLGQRRSDQNLISMVIIDSRDAEAECLFFALPGSNVDGHDFVDDVLKAGGYAVVRRGYGRGERTIEVDDPLTALQKLAQYQLKQIDILLWLNREQRQDDNQGFYCSSFGSQIFGLKPKEITTTKLECLDYLGD